MQEKKETINDFRNIGIEKLKKQQLDFGSTQEVVDFLITNLLSINYAQLKLSIDHPMEKISLSDWQKILSDVASGIPPQYVLRQAPFFLYDFYVNNKVLIPRQETEELVNWILMDFNEPAYSFLDIGTGSGSIASTLLLQREKWQATLSDIDSEALEVAKKNVQTFGLLNRASLVISKTFANIEQKTFDFIVSNPPYIDRKDSTVADSVREFEPDIALFAEQNGLATIFDIILGAPKFLKKNAPLYLEIGEHQYQVIKKFIQQNFPNANIKVRKDANNKERMLKITW